jgi:hypothetical protein
MAHAPRHRTRARGRIAAHKRRETVSAHRPGLLCQSRSYPVSVLYLICLSTRGRRKYCISNLVSRWCAPVRAACSSGQIISACLTSGRPLVRGCRWYQPSYTPPSAFPLMQLTLYSDPDADGRPSMLIASIHASPCEAPDNQWRKERPHAPYSGKQRKHNSGCMYSVMSFVFS